MSFDMWTCQEGPIFPKWKQPAKKETFLWTGPLKFCGAYVLHSFLDGWFMLITYPGPTFNLYKWIPFPSPSLKTSKNNKTCFAQTAWLLCHNACHKQSNRPHGNTKTGESNGFENGSLAGWIPKITASQQDSGFNEWMTVDGWTVLSVFVCKKKW